LNELNQPNHLSANNAEKPVLEFPVTYELKVIFDTTLQQEVHQRNLELVLEDAAVEFSDVKFKPSRQGNYMSISVKVNLDTETQMQLLYKQLRLLPGIKLAI
jgi:putative lipoic acid-binding regulatory protein